MLKFLARHQRSLFRLSACFAILSVCLICSGCAGAPTFLTDLEAVIPLALSAITGILGVVSPAAASILSPYVTKIESDLTELEKLQNEYKANASEGVLADIESLVTTTTGDIASLASANGLPPADVTIAQQVAAVLEAAFASLVSSIQLLKSSTAGQTLTVVKPIAAAELKAKIDTALTPAA